MLFSAIPWVNWLSLQIKQQAVYVIFSLLQVPSQGFPPSGQLPLGHFPVLKGFGVRPLNRGFPGCSWTFTEVPLGPGYWPKTSLTYLANSEFLVAGTLKVVVALSFLNHMALFVFLFSV